MSDTLIIVKMFCAVCDTFTWHVHCASVSWDCLRCRSQDLEDALKDNFIILSQ